MRGYPNPTANQDAAETPSDSGGQRGERIEPSRVRSIVLVLLSLYNPLPVYPGTNRAVMQIMMQWLERDAQLARLGE